MSTDDARAAVQAPRRGGADRLGAADRRRDVDVTAARPPRSRLLIDVGYRVRATNTLHNLVYPFYLEEGAAP